MNKAPNRLWCAGLLLCAAAAQAGGTVYRWVDSQGKVHYSDLPQTSAKVVKPKAQSAGVAAAKAQAAAREQSAEDCQRKKDKLESYRNAAKITETNGLGETHEYTDEERKKLLDTAEQAVATACNPA